MNLPELNRKLLAAARREAPAEKVPYAFERRIMARLAAAPKPDLWAVLVRPLWYGAAACAAVALMLHVWSFQPAQGEEQHAFSRGVEDSLMAPADDLELFW